MATYIGLQELFNLKWNIMLFHLFLACLKVSNRKGFHELALESIRKEWYIIPLEIEPLSFLNREELG